MVPLPDIAVVAEAEVVIEWGLRAPWEVDNSSGGFTVCSPLGFGVSSVEEGIGAGPATMVAAGGVSLGNPGASDWSAWGVFAAHSAADPSVPSTCTGIDVVWKNL